MQLQHLLLHLDVHQEPLAGARTSNSLDSLDSQPLQLLLDQQLLLHSNHSRLLCSTRLHLHLPTTETGSAREGLLHVIQPLLSSLHPCQQLPPAKLHQSGD